MKIRVAARIERKQMELPRYAVVPAKAIAAWKLRETTTVLLQVNGCDAGRKSLKPWDAERWFVDIPETLCRLAKVDTGDAVRLELEIASEDLPVELAALLAADAGARRRWDGMTKAQQRMLRENVAAAKQQATRARRAAAILAPGGV